MHIYKIPLLPLLADFILQAQVLCQRCGSLRDLHSILSVPRTVLFCIEILDAVPGICWRHSLSLGVTALRALITTGYCLHLSHLLKFFSQHL